ncbi:MAG: virulence RhuM family protein [Gammaproteobacteria bacterium]|nr:virulence RhuM family protein [Gammaproteobacteria bacterium]
MTLRDWITQLDDFLHMTGREVLAHAGKVAAEAAQTKTEGEFAVYREQQQLAAPSRAERDFEAAISQPIKQIEKTRKPARVPAKKKGRDT